MTDLEWLARNVHKWNGNYEYLGFNRQYRRYEFFNMSFSACHERFTRDQWLAERARLQNKPKWEDAPDWAQYRGQCGSGYWEWYEGEPHPEPDGDYWAHPGLVGESDYRYKGEVLGNWQDTLERRPEVSCKRCEDEIAECDCNIRRQLDTSAHVNTSAWDGDGLPPIGIDCEYLNHITKTVDHCTVIAEHDGGVVVAVHEDDLTYSYHQSGRPNQFRPIRSEEDRAVEEMVGLLDVQHWSAEEFARELYRAGYRKTEVES